MQVPGSQSLEGLLHKSKMSSDLKQTVRALDGGLGGAELFLFHRGAPWYVHQSEVTARDGSKSD